MADVEVDEVLAVIADVEQLSFYGMHHWLGETAKILERIDDSLLSKKRSPLEERKDELVDAQKRLRNSMGALVQNLSFTKRERPLAEDFLRQQLAKIEKAQMEKTQGPAAEKAATAREKLRQLIEDLGKSKPAPETKEVQEIEESIKAAEAEWKEVSPIYEKWEKGKHSFKTNADLQAMRRRYTECQRIRETGSDRLLKALCSSREGKALARPQEAALPKGWSAVAKKAPQAATGGASRPKQAPIKRAPAPSAWGSAAISFAQRLRAQASAQVREEARTGQENEEGDESEEDDRGGAEQEREVKPEVAARPRPKPPPPLPANVDGFTPVKTSAASRPAPRASPKAAPISDDDGDEEEEVETTKVHRPTGYNASAKKKGKGKQKKGGDQDDEDVLQPCEKPERSQASTADWASAATTVLEGSLLKDLLRSQSWRWPEDEDIGNERLQSLIERLDWVNPLGLALTMEWKQFLSLEVDGGPPRTSRRGTAPWITRVGQNAPVLLGHYITIIFGFTFLQELSFFGFPMWALLLQAGLILLPPEASPYLQSPHRLLGLQAAHLLLWLLFVRSLWQMHFFVKVLCALLAGSHAYVVAPVGER